VAKKKSDKVVEEGFDKFLERTYGEGIIQTADKIIDKKREILKTALSLDISLSGGIPSGVTCLLSGKSKVGKTSLCLHILKNAINDGRPAFYVDIERRCSQSLLKTIAGLNTEKLNIIKSTPDKVLSAEDWFRIIEQTIKDNPRAVTVVDSIAALSTMAEQSELIGDNRDMAGTPKLLASFFRKVQQTIDDNDNIVIFLSQLQTNREPNGKKFIEKGGLAIGYACSVWLNVNWAKIWDKDPDTNEPDGQDLMVNVVCSALGKPYIPCSIPLRYGEGIDTAKDVIIHAENLGLIQKSGSWYNIPSILDENKNPLKLQGLDKIREYFKNNPEHIVKFENEIREILLPK
jgi:recombination protein RecA